MAADPLPDGPQARAVWVATLERVAGPVFNALARGELRRSMPVETRPGMEADRARFSHLEALGRSLAGIAPWLECTVGLTDEEETRRAAFTALAIRAIDQATDPGSPDFLNFTDGSQGLVDAAFLSQGLLRAPSRVLAALDDRVRTNVVRCLRATRMHPPPHNNWLLFSAMIEALLAFAGEDWDEMRVEYAIRQHEQWYQGDGAYGDGPFFHWDYYNSFVIQPMLVDVLRAVGERTRRFDAFVEPVRRRAARYAAVLERLIAPDASFPVIGRSMAYRCGAFQSLAQAALLGFLPPELSPAQARSALTAVIKRVIDAPGTFDADGWLRIGLCGHQPGLGEHYISTGSLYLCLCGMLPLGLPPSDAFWLGPAVDWTSRRVWSGVDAEADRAITG